MISILDIEASGFGPQSYPIEIGVVTKDNERYCALIKPFDDWSHWDQSAEVLHGISRDILKDRGTPAQEVCFSLNQLLSNSTVYCDAWTHDSLWLRVLFYRSAIRPTFTLSAIEYVAKEEQLMIWDGTKKSVIEKLKLDRHRASYDAMVIQKTFEQTRKLIA